MRLRQILTISITLFMIALPALAADLYVYPDGVGGSAPTIQDAVDAASSGDTVWLMPGTFTGPGNRDVEIFRSLTIRGNGQPEECIIDCGGDEGDPHQGLILESCTVSLINLTITGANGSDGAALWVTEGGVDAEYCFLHDNAATDDGGAVYCDDYSSLSFFRCRFANNRADDDGGAIFATAGSDITISRCTLADNKASSGSGVFLDSDASCDIVSTIIAFGRGGAACSHYYSPNFSITHTDIFGNAGGDWVEGAVGQSGGTGNVHMEPRLCDPMAPVPNLGLSANSPCAGIGPHGFIGYIGPDPGWSNPVYGLRPDGTGMFATIQDALDAVPPSSVVSLEDGEYSGLGNREVDFTGLPVTLRSRADDPETCALITPGYRTLLLDGDDDHTTIIRSLSFRNDSAPAILGGAVLVTGPSGARFENCLFTEITTYTPGSAFLIDAAYADPATIALEGCRFDDLSSHNHGGAIKAVGWHADIRNCVFTYASSGAGFNGGFIHASEYPAMRIESTQFLTATAGGGLGGGLYLADSPTSQVEFIDVRTLGLYAVTHGGGVYLTNAGDVTFTSCDIDWNYTDGYGGFIYATATVDHQTLNLEGCDIEGWGGGDHPEAVYGGGVYAEHLASVTISDTYFRDLGAESGAGIYVESTPLYVYDALFEDNIGYGGPAIRALNTTVDIAGCEVTRNQSESEGAFSLANSQGTIIACSFTENRGGYSSAILLTGGNGHYDVERCLFWSNTSEANTTISVVSCDATFTSCTLHGNKIEESQSDQSQVSGNAYADINLDYCIISGGVRAAAVNVNDNATCILTCCDLYGNEYGDWVGPIADQLNDEGNLWALPLFCNGSVGNVALNENSPCLEDNNICGANIGLYGQGCTGGVGVEETPVAVTAPTLRPNFPNPFNPTTTIAYDLPRACAVSLRVLDVNGRSIATLRNGSEETAGSHAVVWQGRDDAGIALPSGFYFAELRADGSETTQRMLLLK